jgi:hypothetical protein
MSAVEETPTERWITLLAKTLVLFSAGLQFVKATAANFGAFCASSLARLYFTQHPGLNENESTVTDGR